MRPVDLHQGRVHLQVRIHEAALLVGQRSHFQHFAVEHLVGKRIHDDRGRLSRTDLVHLGLVHADLGHHGGGIGHRDDRLAFKDGLALGDHAAAGATASSASHRAEHVSRAAGAVDHQARGLGAHRAVGDLLLELADALLLRPEPLLGVGQSGLRLRQFGAAFREGSFELASGFNVVAQGLLGILREIVTKEQIQIHLGVLLGEFPVDDREPVPLQIQFRDVIGVVELLRSSQSRLRRFQVALGENDVVVQPLQLLPGGRAVQHVGIIPDLHQKRRHVLGQVHRIVDVSRQPFRQSRPEVLLKIQQSEPNLEPPISNVALILNHLNVVGLLRGGLGLLVAGQFHPLLDQLVFQGGGIQLDQDHPVVDVLLTDVRPGRNDAQDRDLRAARFHLAAVLDGLVRADAAALADRDDQVVPARRERAPGRCAGARIPLDGSHQHDRACRNEKENQREQPSPLLRSPSPLDGRMFARRFVLHRTACIRFHGAVCSHIPSGLTCKTPISRKKLIFAIV